MSETIDFTQFKTYSIKERKSRVQVKDFAKPLPPELLIGGFFDSLPDILAGRTIRAILQAAVEAYRKGRGLIWGIGAHVIKCGLSLVMIELINKGIITALAMNGAGLIHDFEIAFFGQTSEDVAEGLKEGKFGMAEETGKLLNEAINEGVGRGLGLAESVGLWIVEKAPDFCEYSLLAAAIKARVKLTAHVAIGTDIIHMHPSADGACLGAGSLKDFHTFTQAISTLNQGGIYFNVGSAVILPEVFLKAMTLAINLGYPLKDFTTVNLDFIQHYRSIENVVKRPLTGRGTGYSLIGHHEILIPLLAAGIKEGICNKG